MGLETVELIISIELEDRKNAWMEISKIVSEVVYLNPEDLKPETHSIYDLRF